MDSQPLLSVIIPNWNGKHFLSECVDSLKEQTFRDFETILVDNGSTDGSAEFAEKRYGDFIRIIRNEKNLGFTGGNNVGIRAARGRYIVLLNNDTWAEPTWLEELVKATYLDPPVGMWASKVYSYYKRNQIEAVGELIYWDGLSRSRGQFEQEQGQYEEMEEIFFPPGCGAMYRKAVFDEIGLFDEDFFAYADDAEIGIRARLAGWKCVYVPKAILYHKNSGSTGHYSPFKAFYVERNRFWITVKYFPLPLLLLSFFLHFPSVCFSSLRGPHSPGGRWEIYEKLFPFELIGILLKAYGSGFRYCPECGRREED